MITEAYQRVKSRISKVLGLKSSYQHVFDTPDGQIVMMHICKIGYVFKSTFVKGDPYETAQREGMRRMALSILRFVYRDSEGLMKQLEKGYQDEDNESATA